VVDGILGSRERIHNLKGATHMQLYQDPIAKHFNYGTITIFFLGGSEVNLTNIRNPHIRLTHIQSLLDKGYIEEI